MGGGFKLKNKPYLHGGVCQRHYDPARARPKFHMNYVCALCPHRVIENDYCGFYGYKNVLSEQVNGQRRRIVHCDGLCAKKHDRGVSNIERL